MSLPKISVKEFEKKLAAMPLDNIETVRLIESLLIKQGGVFTMPPPESPVILLVSGGLDSIVCWGILMEEYGLKVYPVTMKKGQKRRKFEERSLKFFTQFYKKKYPQLFIEPFVIDAYFPTIDLPIEKYSKVMHPEIILDNLAKNIKIPVNLSLGSSILSPIIAKFYAQYLNYTQNLRINTIFCGILPSDGGQVPEQSFTAIRSAQLYLRLATHDNNWQFSSVCYEKETGIYLLKKDLVKWAHDHHLPLEKTWTCQFSYRLHCGHCATCYGRKNAFTLAGVPDKTGYMDEIILLKTKIKSRLKKIKGLVLLWLS